MDTRRGISIYCGAPIAAGFEGIRDVEVDHFFPHVLKQFGFGPIMDGIWNLVLACPECNRGPRGKFAQVPSLQLLQKLHERNEFLINSHHPLRETLMMQTGTMAQIRIRFLNDIYNKARAALIHIWDPSNKEIEK